MDMNKLRRELDSIKGGMEDINSLLVETEKTSKDMVQRIADFSSIANKGGIVRSILTRASAGIPGVYQLMQQLSSVLLVFKYLVVARNADLKAEQEMIESLKKRESVQRRLYNLEASIKKDKNGDLSFLEKEKFYNDASIKHLMRTMSLTEALNVTQKRFRGVQETAQKADEKILSKSRRQYVKDNFFNKEKIKKNPLYDPFTTRFSKDISVGSLSSSNRGGMGIKTITGRRMFGKNLEAKAGILMADEEIERMKERRMGLTAETTGAKIRQNDLKIDINSGLLSDTDKKAAEKDLALVEDLLNTLGDSIEGINSDMQIAFKERSVLLKGSKLKGFKVSGASGSRKFTDLGFFEKKQLQYQKFRERIDKKMTSVRKGLSTFFSRGNISLMLNTLKASFAFLGYALLVILGIGLIVYTMKKTGIWDKIAEFIKVKWPEFKYYFEEMWVGIKIIASGFWDYIKGIWKLVKGLFTGDNKLIKEGLGLILKGVGKMLGGAMIVISGLAGLYAKFLVTSFFLGVDILKAAFESIKKKTGKVAKGALVGAASVGLVLGGLALAGTGVGLAPGLAMVGIGAGMGAGIGNQMVSGGTVLSGGNFLVGENGPELVTLPGGTSVTNNTNTRSSLGPTINVHVNGRVGASDQELNEIARKIGNKINIEMNRFNSRGYRA